MKNLEEIVVSYSVTDFLSRFKSEWEKQERKQLKWENLNDYKCPICGNKLRFTFEGEAAFCKGKRHKKRFYITYDKFKQVVG